ncbi:MAG TPA: histone deacetylase [Bryobacteraceae bacterium]|jgi:acetoin utilization deacetylase AcuC-like enzyme|nr:histone deacetylase [Bryobacteraceae bacterium]
MPPTALAADSGVKQHNPGSGHPEQPARFDAVLNQLKSGGLMQRLHLLASRRATDDELALVHTRDYIALVEAEVAAHRTELSTGDTQLNAQSSEAARLAAGSVLNAVDAVFDGHAQNAFCLVRPPGHHASSARGMGFCLFNNIAIATRYAQQRHGAERVLIVDWDVHHGNSTQDIFYRDGSVLFFSTHQSPWYPGTGAESETGEGPGAGATINCPLPAGTGSAAIFQAFRDKLLPAAEAFRPDAIFLSAGFDSRVGDPLGQFLLTDDDFRELTNLVCDLASRHSQNRIISLLEGGYNLEGLAQAAATHVRALTGSHFGPELKRLGIA